MGIRTIIFRGKTYSNKWVYGYLLKGSIDNDFYILENVGATPFWIDTDTVGQFTGLTDKNGTKIFEGDIVKVITLDTNTERLAVVGFGKFVDENNDDEYLGFYIEFNGFKTTITQLEMEEVKDRFEVIGNIHDNPELLEVKV